MYCCLFCKKETTSIRGHLGRCKAYRNFRPSLITDEELIELYVNQELSIPDIVKTNPFFSNKFIHKKLKQLGINRNSSQACKNAELKRRETNQLRYGSNHNFNKNHPSRIKWESKLFEKEGITNVFQREEVKRKSRDTLIKKYGVTSSHNLNSGRGRKPVSSLNLALYDYLDKNQIPFKVEFKLPKGETSFYSYDILIEPALIIEINGDYWHGNPKIYDENDLILKGSSGEKLVSDKWVEDALKIETAENAGFSVLVIWENDWKNNFENIECMIWDEINENQKYKEDISERPI